MTFTSIVFLFVFLPITLMIYYFFYALEAHWRMLKKFRLLDCILVILSLFFYSWACFDDVFKLIVYVIIVWGAGICLHKVKAKKKLPTIMSVIALIAVLFYFKYYNFFIEIWNNLLATGVKKKIF